MSKKSLKFTVSVTKPRTRKKHEDTKSEYFGSARRNKSAKKGKGVMQEGETDITNYEEINLGCYVKYLSDSQFGKCRNKSSYSKQVIINQIKKFQVSTTQSFADQRCTAMCWHPKEPEFLASGSKGGSILFWRNNKLENYQRGVGPGGSILNMKFDAHNRSLLYVASMSGTFASHDIVKSIEHDYLRTDDYKVWYVSCDTNGELKMLSAGTNKGNLSLLSKDGCIIKELRVSTSSVTNLEFNPRDPNLLCASSSDKTIRLFDMRCIRDSQQPLVQLKMATPVNAAYFSLTDSCRLLATDQNSHIMVYRAPLWHEETVIRHPHRQFQHLTPIRAHWHPFEDIVVVGRYPDPTFPGYEHGELRTIDLFDASTGRLLYQLSQSGYNQIGTLNRFNPEGTLLATACGFNFLLWRDPHKDRC